MNKLTKRQKYWLYEVLSWVVIAVAVVLFREQALWEYFVLGVCFGLYHQLQKRQEGLGNRVTDLASTNPNTAPDVTNPPKTKFTENLYDAK